MDISTPRINRLSQVGRFLRLVGLFFWMLWVMYRERQRVVVAQACGKTPAHPSRDVLVQVLTVFREEAMRQGGLLIKLGQFLSAHVDLLPQQAIAALASLQDEDPPAPFAHVVSVIESELGKSVEEVFRSLERECVAAASLGQVHKAVLASTGETVAVKIQRPQVERIIRLDLRALKFVIWVLTRFMNTHHVVDLMGFHDEFERTIYQELDYVREAANIRRFQDLFKDDPTISIPRVYDQYVSRRVLVLEWVDGMKITAYPALDAAGINRLEAAKRIAHAYFFQFFEAGFFHADPHPGNLLIKPGATGDDPLVTFVDFGMVGFFTSSMRRSMKEAFLAIVARDAPSLGNALTQLGFTSEGVNRASFEQALGQLIERYAGLTLEKMNKEVLAGLGQDLKHLLYEQAVHIPVHLVLTGRALGTLSGVLTGLAPEFNFLEVATPYARAFLRPDLEDVEQIVQQLLIQVLDIGRAWLALPQTLERAMTKLETGQLEVKPVGNDSREGSGVRRCESGRGEAFAAPGFTWPFMFAASLMGGIVLLTDAHQLVAGWFCFGLAALCILRTWVKS